MSDLSASIILAGKYLGWPDNYKIYERCREDG